MNTTHDQPGSMPFETEADRMNVFNAGYEFAIRNRPKHCTTKIELFKSFWRHNLYFMIDDLGELTDRQIESYISQYKSIGDAVYSAAHWVLDQPK